jgi:hypothetical protein
MSLDFAGIHFRADPVTVDHRPAPIRNSGNVPLSLSHRQALENI